MNLEKAIQIAVEAHAGTKDKGGKAYILHPISVMMRVETEEEKIEYFDTPEVLEQKIAKLA